MNENNYNSITSEISPETLMAFSKFDADRSGGGDGGDNGNNDYYKTLEEVLTDRFTEFEISQIRLLYSKISQFKKGDFLPERSKWLDLFNCRLYLIKYQLIEELLRILVYQEIIIDEDNRYQLLTSAPYIDFSEITPKVSESSNGNLRYTDQNDIKADILYWDIIENWNEYQRVPTNRYFAEKYFTTTSSISRWMKNLHKRKKIIWIKHKGCRLFLGRSLVDKNSTYKTVNGMRIIQLNGKTSIDETHSNKKESMNIDLVIPSDFKNIKDKMINSICLEQYLELGKIKKQKKYEFSYKFNIHHMISIFPQDLICPALGVRIELFDESHEYYPVFISTDSFKDGKSIVNFDIGNTQWISKKAFKIVQHITHQYESEDTEMTSIANFTSWIFSLGLK